MNTVIRSNQDDSRLEPYNPTHPGIGPFNLPKDHININVYAEHDNNPETLMDILATQLAELWLTEKGFNFVPGLIALWKRITQTIEAKACIEPFRKETR